MSHNEELIPDHTKLVEMFLNPHVALVLYCCSSSYISTILNTTSSKGSVSNLKQHWQTNGCINMAAKSGNANAIQTWHTVPPINVFWHLELQQTASKFHMQIWGFCAMTTSGNCNC